MIQSLVTGGKEIVVPFSRQPIVMKPVGHDEYIQMLRDQVANTKRMPSSIGERIHSKPEYFSAHNHEHFLNQCICFWTATYARWEQKSDDQCYVVIPIDGLCIVAGLKTLELWVGIPGRDECWLWEWPKERDLCIDRIELSNQFNQLG